VVFAKLIKIVADKLNIKIARKEIEKRVASDTLNTKRPKRNQLKSE
jgi:hypothetical protein